MTGTETVLDVTVSARCTAHMELAERDGRAVECVAIVPDGTGAWELSKMAVAPQLRGRGA